MTLFRLKISSYSLNYFGQGMAAATPCHMGSSATGGPDVSPISLFLFLFSLGHATPPGPAGPCVIHGPTMSRTGWKIVICTASPIFPYAKGYVA